MPSIAASSPRSQLLSLLATTSLCGLAAAGCRTKDSTGDSTQSNDQGIATNDSSTGNGEGSTAATSGDTGSDAQDSSQTTATNTTMTTESSEEDSDDMETLAKFDLGMLPDFEISTEGEDVCDEVAHSPCDDPSDDPLHAIGVNCPGEVPVFTTSFFGDERGRGIRSKLGNTDAFDPREGKKYLVLGSGNVADLDNETPAMNSDLSPTECNDDLGSAGDVGAMLPAPLNPKKVGTVDCIADPTLVGTGDCSNTIEDQWNAAGQANDYQELRLKVRVPEWANSLSYDFAFSTTEYPYFFSSDFNDMFVAWLESEKWTGNVSFDEMGNPISLNAGFLDYRDAEMGTTNDPACTMGCTAPELHGSCMKQHAGTKWLTTSFGVTPGEEIELIFAIFDLKDSILDSYVFIDNLIWSCERKTIPETFPPK